LPKWQWTIFRKEEVQGDGSTDSRGGSRELRYMRQFCFGVYNKTSPRLCQTRRQAGRSQLRRNPYLSPKPSCLGRRSTVNMTLRSLATLLQFSWRSKPRNLDPAREKKLVAVDLPCPQPVLMHAQIRAIRQADCSIEVKTTFAFGIQCSNANRPKACVTGRQGNALMEPPYVESTGYRRPHA